MKGVFKATVITYTLIMILSLSMLPFTQNSYTVEKYGPLEKPFTGIIDPVYYGGRGAVLLKTHTSNGVGLIELWGGGEGVYYSLPGVSDVLSACMLNDTIIILGRDEFYNTLILMLGDGLSAWRLVSNNYSLPVEEGEIYCFDGRVVATIGFADKTYITSINFTSNSVDSVRVPGKYASSTSADNHLIIAVNSDETIILVYYYNNGTKTYRVGLKNIYKLVYSDKLYLIGEDKTRAIIASPDMNKSLIVYYNNISAPKIESVVEKEGRLVFLSRPPGGWMQVVEFSGNSVSNVELMHTEMYSFKKAGMLPGGLFWTIGITYNNTLKTITIDKVYRDSQALIGGLETILAAKKTSNTPHISHTRINYEPINIPMKMVNITLRDANITISQQSIQVPSRSYNVARDPIMTILTYIALILPFTTLSYVGGKQYIQPKHLTS